MAMSLLIGGTFMQINGPEAEPKGLRDIMQGSVSGFHL